MSGVIYALHFGRKKRYIGSTNNIKRRISAHWALLAKGKHHSVALQNAVNKYGLDTLLIEVLLDNVPLDRLLIEEQRFLDQHKGYTYNCSPTASSRRGCKERPEARARRVSAMIGNSYRKGILHDAHARSKISEGVKRAIADGRLVRDREAFDRLRSEVASGVRKNPWRRQTDFVIDVLSRLHQIGSISKTADLFGMNKENVRAILRQAERALNCMFGQRSTRKRHTHGYFIHPDWFPYLEEALT